MKEQKVTTVHSRYCIVPILLNGESYGAIYGDQSFCEAEETARNYLLDANCKKVEVMDRMARRGCHRLWEYYMDGDRLERCVIETRGIA